MSDSKSHMAVKRYSEARVPTEYGEFTILVYREGDSADSTAFISPSCEHVAVINGDLRGQEDVHVRVHSECLTGEVLHSLKCDCREQLDFAMRHIASQECGVVIYLRQEGRGIGLGNKIRAYALQQDGADTVEANRLLGFADDARSYHVASEILKDLGPASVKLLTNNPLKLEGLRADGINVTGRVPVEIQPNEHNASYLETKRARMGHEL